MKTGYIIGVLLMSAISYSLLGVRWHEWLGAGFVVAVCVHIGRQAPWIGRILVGRYGAYRTVQTEIAILLLVVAITVVGTGFGVAKYIVTGWASGEEAETVRILHAVSTRWLFLLASLHIGLHGQGIMLRMRKSISQYSVMNYGRIICLFSRGWQWLRYLLMALGIVAWIKFDYTANLWWPQESFFFDASQPIVTYLAGHLCIAALGIGAGHFLRRCCIR